MRATGTPATDRASGPQSTASRSDIQVAQVLAEILWVERRVNQNLPASSEVYLQLGAAYERVGDVVQAEVAYDAARDAFAAPHEAARWSERATAGLDPVVVTEGLSRRLGSVRCRNSRATDPDIQIASGPPPGNPPATWITSTMTRCACSPPSR